MYVVDISTKSILTAYTWMSQESKGDFVNSKVFQLRMVEILDIVRMIRFR